MKKFFYITFLILILLLTIIVSCDRFEFLSEKEYNSKYGTTTTTTTTIDKNRVADPVFEPAPGNINISIDETDKHKIQINCSTISAEIYYFEDRTGSDPSFNSINMNDLNDPRLQKYNKQTGIPLMPNSDTYIRIKAIAVSVGLLSSNVIVAVYNINWISSTTTTTNPVTSNIEVAFDGSLINNNDIYDFKEVSISKGKSVTVKITNTSNKKITLKEPVDNETSTTYFKQINWNLPNGGNKDLDPGQSVDFLLIANSSSITSIDNIDLLINGIESTNEITFFQCKLKANFVSGLWRYIGNYFSGTNPALFIDEENNLYVAFHNNNKFDIRKLYNNELWSEFNRIGLNEDTITETISLYGKKGIPYVAYHTYNGLNHKINTLCYNINKWEGIKDPVNTYIEVESGNKYPFIYFGKLDQYDTKETPIIAYVNKSSGIDNRPIIKYIPNQSWDNYGSYEYVNDSKVTYPSIYVYNYELYFAYAYSDTTKKYIKFGKLIKNGGSEWIPDSFTYPYTGTSSVCKYVSLYIANDTAYIGFVADNNKIMIRKLYLNSSSPSWLNITGDNKDITLSSGSIYNASFAMKDGNFYVAYIVNEGGGIFKPYVKRIENNKWTDVRSDNIIQIFSLSNINSIDIKLNNSNVPYIVYCGELTTGDFNIWTMVFE